MSEEKRGAVFASIGFAFLFSVLGYLCEAGSVTIIHAIIGGTIGAGLNYLFNRIDEISDTFKAKRR